MNLIFKVLYQWATGSQSEYMNQFQNATDAMKSQAQVFWNNLSNFSPIALGVFIGMSLLLAWGYYIPFNNVAGRHYLPRYWWMFFATTAIVAFLATYGFELAIIHTSLKNVATYEIKLALANSLYAILLYLVWSFVFCKYSNTNAYKMF